MTVTKPKVGFIGAGKVGTALAVGLDTAGYPVVAVTSRTVGSAEALSARLSHACAVGPTQAVIEAADLIFVTTPDVLIGPLVESLRWRPGTAVVHTSGVESRELLATAAAAGAATGSLHPLQTFADRDHAASRLSGCVFAVEAEGALRDTLLAMVEALRGVPVELRAEDKALYHASAVLVSNYVVTLTHLAAGLWQRFGVGRPDAVRALLPLLQGAVFNIETLGLPDALTGPIARGDTVTVQRHLAGLSDVAPNLLPTYKALALQTIPIALAKGGLTGSEAANLRDILLSAISGTKAGIDKPAHPELVEGLMKDKAATFLASGSSSPREDGAGSEVPIPKGD